MPQNYTVQSGDTLSAIGKKYGVDYNQISGYKSGNPNLIYPNEVLTIPDSASSRPIPSLPNAGEIPSSSDGNYKFTSSPSMPSVDAGSMKTPVLDYNKQLTDQLMAEKDKYQGKVNTAQQALIDYYAGLEDPTSKFNKLNTQYGVEDQQTMVNALTKDVMGQQDLLDQLDPAITERSKDFAMTESDRVSLLAKESTPVIKQLNTLLRNKQYEEIGLAGKQQLVKDLLQLSIQGDEMKARPLQLGVDYSTQEMKIALDLMSSVNSAKSSAFSTDYTNNTNLAMKKYDVDMNQYNKGQDQAFSKEMAQFTSDLSLKNSLALKNASKSETAKDDSTNSVWDMVVGDSKSEWDVWKNISDNGSKYAAMGVDMDKLWAKFYELKAKVGKDGLIRKESSSDSTDYSNYAG